MAGGDFARFFIENNNPEIQKLGDLIDNLYLDLNSFTKNFKTIIRNLNALYKEDLISQELFDDCLHTISSDITKYINSKIIPLEVLAYQCCICNKYFLEQNEYFLKEEIQTRKSLNYVSSGICSEECLRIFNPKLADKIINRTK